MKKFIAIALIVVVCAAVAGCGSAKIEETSNISTEKPVTETTEEIAETEATTEPAVDYPDFIWPGFGLSELLPHPDWITNGKVEYDSSAFSANISNVSRAQFKEYVKACYDMGFNDIRTNNDTAYCAFNMDGLSIYIEHREGSVMHIWIG